LENPSACLDDAAASPIWAARQGGPIIRPR
jgi:hypothetical protein